MPYRIVGNKVVRRSTGEVVGRSNNPKKYIQVLNAIEHNPEFAEEMKSRRRRRK